MLFDSDVNAVSSSSGNTKTVAFSPITIPLLQQAPLKIKGRQIQAVVSAATDLGSSNPGVAKSDLPVKRLR